MLTDCGDQACEYYAVAVPGIKGDKGDKGDPGASGVVAEYYHHQDTPSSSWTVPHMLNKQIVGALVYSPDMGTEYGAAFVEQLDPNNCRIWVSPPLAGIARIF